jgi:hypothetical protein
MRNAILKIKKKTHKWNIWILNEKKEKVRQEFWEKEKEKKRNDKYF